MKFAVGMFQTDQAIDVVSLGRAAEERNFESLWFPEHTHIPTSRRSPWPGGADLPEEYKRTLDLFVALAAVAATTERLKLGLGICLVIQRDPIVLAKEVASLDFLSGGRVLFGIGGGWNKEEMEHHGTNPATRWHVLRERVLAMKEIWTNDVAEFHGDYVNFDPLWQWPKPAQQPHPPVLIGGNGASTFDRILEYGDGWMPLAARPGGALDDRIVELQRLAAERGRPPVPITLFGAPRDPEAVAHYESLGVERLIFMLPPAGADVVLPKLDSYAEVALKFSS
jgi:probable F420-dependent oxidoreductase